MANVTLTSPDLAVGEQLQVQIVNGDGVIFLTIIGAAGGGGGGTVTDVTGTDPIVVTNSTTTPNVAILPATDADAGSMSAADKAKLDGLTTTDLWPYDVPIPASVAAPILAQAQAIAAGVHSTRLMTQSAFVGSAEPGGDLSLVNGKPDGNVSTNVWIGVSTVADTTLCLPPSVNFNGWGKFLFNLAGGVPIFTLGLGTNSRGAGIAGNEISSFGLMNLATEQVGSSDATITFAPIINATRGVVQVTSDGTLGLGELVFFDTDLATSALTGLIRLPWGSSSTGPGLKLLVQRDAANTVDIPIIARGSGLLEFGNNTDNPLILGSQQLAFLLNVGGGAGVGWNFIAVSRHFGINTDPQHTIAQGGNAGLPLGSGRDTFVSQMYAGNSTSTASQALLTTPILAAGSTAGVPSVTYYQCTLTAVDQVTHQWTSCELKIGVMGLAGVVSLAAGVQLGPLNVQESNLGLMATLSPTFTVSGTNLNLQLNGTPWSTNTIHYMLRAAETINEGGF